jgi:hypothetical protein
MQAHTQTNEEDNKTGKRKERKMYLHGLTITWRNCVKRKQKENTNYAIFQSCESLYGPNTSIPLSTLPLNALKLRPMSYKNKTSKCGCCSRGPIPRHSGSKCWSNGMPETYVRHRRPILCAALGTNTFPQWNPYHCQLVHKAYITVYNTHTWVQLLNVKSCTTKTLLCSS